MYRNCGNIADRLHIPDFRKQLILRKHAIRILRQESQQIKFLGGKLLFLSIDPHPTGSLINLNTADLNNIILRHIASDQPLIAGQMRFYTRHHLTWAKGLRNIIIRTKTQTADLIDIILLCRNQDHRRIFRFTDFTADLKSVHPRKHKIQNKQIKISLQRPLQTGISPVFNLHRKSGKLQIILFQLSNRFLILYDQYFTHILVPPDIF